jgi:hypothetical protein
MSTDAVTPLRQRMIEDMNARKLGAHSQRSHIYSCKRFAAFLKRAPDTATPDDVRRFQLHLAETGMSICNRNRIMTGVKFLFHEAADAAGAPHPAISRLGAFRTPAVRARGWFRNCGVRKPAQKQTTRSPCRRSAGIRIGDLAPNARLAARATRKYRAANGGVLLHETRDHLADLKVDERRWATDPHDALRLGAHAVDGFLGGLGLDNHRYAMAIIFPTDLCNGEASRRAVDELYAKAILQEADAAA